MQQSAGGTIILTHSTENKRSSDMDAAVEVSIRPIQCKVDNVSGYTLLVHVGAYDLILLSGKEHTLNLIGADNVQDIIKQLANDIQALRNSKRPAEAYIEPIQQPGGAKNVTGSVVRVSLPSLTSTSKKPIVHNLLLAHGESDRIAPTLFNKLKEAQVHAGEIIDIIGNYQVDWRQLKIRDKSITLNTEKKK